MSPPLGQTAARRRYYGKYQGTVVSNIDPIQTGRVQVQVPDVLGPGVSSSWAMPCVPAAGIQGGAFIVPPIGSQVWVEFEQGDPDYPIWTGGFWGLVADVPVLATAPPAIPPGQNIVIQTTGQNSLVLSDAPPSPATGGIIIKGASGAMIVVNETGIYISNGQGAMITLIGPTVAGRPDQHGHWTVAEKETIMPGPILQQPEPSSPAPTAASATAHRAESVVARVRDADRDHRRPVRHRELRLSCADKPGTARA